MPLSLLICQSSLTVLMLSFKGQILTLVEYTLLLYRALLPAPVWYRFFLNKEYGSLFSSLTTGLYLTFKLTSIVEKVWIHFILCVCSLSEFLLEDDEILFVTQNCWMCHVESLCCILGPILLCCPKGIITEGGPLWFPCHIRTGKCFPTKCFKLAFEARLTQSRTVSSSYVMTSCYLLNTLGRTVAHGELLYPSIFLVWYLV